MDNSVKYLYILILTCYCGAQWDELENDKIDIPENCSLSYDDAYLCPAFTIWLYQDTKNGTRELFTEVGCKNSAITYDYLRNAHSSRNSLQLVNCQPPEGGSFGEGWPSLEYLRIKNYRDDLQELKREHFSGLNNLSYLRLDTKQVMSDDLLADLPKLSVLIMAVKYANTKLLENLNELVSLELTIKSQDSLNNFDTSVLKTAPKFTKFGLNFNNFKRLTKKFFEGCTNVENLNLNYNTIETIDFDAFEPLTNLQNIEIVDNELASLLPQGLFSKNKKLEKVKIRSSKFLSIPPGLLSNLTNLRDVEISCNLTSLPIDLLRGSNNIEVLDLQFIQLTSLPRDFLQNHSKLRLVKFWDYDKSIFTELRFTADDF